MKKFLFDRHEEDIFVFGELEFYENKLFEKFEDILQDVEEDAKEGYFETYNDLINYINKLIEGYVEANCEDIIPFYYKNEEMRFFSFDDMMSQFKEDFFKYLVIEEA